MITDELMKAKMFHWDLKSIVPLMLIGNVDILLVKGSNDAFPNAPNYYLKITKDYIL